MHQRRQEFFERFCLVFFVLRSNVFREALDMNSVIKTTFENKTNNIITIIDV